jgi:hypothetical protein
MAMNSALSTIYPSITGVRKLAVLSFLKNKNLSEGITASKVPKRQKIFSDRKLIKEGKTEGIILIGY